MKHKSLYFCLCVLLSSICFALSFPNFINREGFWFLAYIFAIPFFFVLDDTKLFKRLVWSIVSAVISYSILVYWLFPISIKGALIFVLFMSLQLVLFSCFYNKIKNNILAFVCVPSVWVLSEYVRAAMFKGYGWGLSYSQSFNSYIVQCVDIFGSYGLSFFIIMINFLLYRMIKEKKINNIFIVVMILSLMFGYGFVKKNRQDENVKQKKVVVSVIQGNVSQDEKWDEAFAQKIQETYRDLSLKVDDKVEILIWPETSLPGDYHVELKKYLIDIMTQIDAQMIFGVSIKENSKFYNRAIWMDKKGIVIDKYDKIKTIPFFEYAPFNKKELYVFNDDNENPVWFSAGDKIGVLDDGNMKIGMLICFEDCFESLTRKLVVNGASFLVNITNDALLGDSAGAYLHLQASILRAVENRISVVRSANTGFSCIINNKGVIINKIHYNNKDLMVSGKLTGSVGLTNTRTVYNRIGYMFPFFCCLLIIIGVTVQAIKNRSSYANSKKTIVLLVILSFFFSIESFPVADKRRMQGQAGPQKQKPQKKRRRYVNIKSVQIKPNAKELTLEKKNEAGQTKRSKSPKQMSVPPQTLTAKNSMRSGSLSSATNSSITPEILNAFSNNSVQWSKINNLSMKDDIVKYYMSGYEKNGVTIKNTPSFYVNMIDTLIKQNPAITNMPLHTIVQTVCIIEYDFDNGQDKDMLAKKVLGEDSWKSNLARLKKQGKI